MVSHVHLHPYDPFLLQTVHFVNEQERLSNITLKTQIKVNEQFVVRKDHMDVNEHERPSNITPRHKLK
jgi:hypothetical protein